MQKIRDADRDADYGLMGKEPPCCTMKGFCRVYSHNLVNAVGQALAAACLVLVGETATLYLKGIVTEREGGT